jgi:hypothetical protein
MKVSFLGTGSPILKPMVSKGNSSVEHLKRAKPKQRKQVVISKEQLIAELKEQGLM